MSHVKENNESCSSRKFVNVVFIILLVVIFNLAYFTYNIGTTFDASCLLELQNSTYEELNSKYSNELDVIENNKTVLTNDLLDYEEGTKEYTIAKEKIEKLDDMKYYLAIYNGNHSKAVQNLLLNVLEFDVGILCGVILGYVVVTCINKNKEKNN